MHPFFRHGWLELVCGIFILLGIILAAFYLHFGALLVGLATGLYFHDEIYQFFLYQKRLYGQRDHVTLLIWIGVFIFFLIALPIFIVATALGYALIHFSGRFIKTK